MSLTRGVILGGSHGWDETGFASVCPLPLMPIAHTPLVGHTLRWFADAGISDITICTNEGWRVGPGLLADPALRGLQITYYSDLAPRGAAGCLRDAGMLFGGDRFVCCDGTILPDVDPVEFIQHHLNRKAALTVGVSADEATEPGAARRGRPLGIYVVESDSLAEVPENGYQDLKEMLVPRLHQKSLIVTTYLADRPCARLSDMQSYLAICADAAVRLARLNVRWDGYRRVSQSQVHETAQVHNPQKLIGPVLIGPGTTIGPDVTIVGPTTIGGGCSVERGAVICSSVIWDRCKILERAVVDHAVVTDGAVIAANVRVDHTLHSDPLVAGLSLHPA